MVVPVITPFYSHGVLCTVRTLVEQAIIGVVRDLSSEFETICVQGSLYVFW
jgi:hypothetical protein